MARGQGTVDSRDIPMSPEEYITSRERGRRLAAQNMIANPEARERVEKAYGVVRCRVQYPEVYGLDAKPQIVLP